MEHSASDDAEAMPALAADLQGSGDAASGRARHSTV
jgi:hypothetical protein